MSINRDKHAINRRDFLKKSALATAVITTGLNVDPLYAGKNRLSKGKKVIVIGIDGMDPRLSERMMDAGLLPNFRKLREAGGYRRLGTSTPPQSPVAWANFITGAGPGRHGIFDFVRRDADDHYRLMDSISYTKPGKGAIGMGDYLLQLNFWPFNHVPPKTILERKGVPLWEYLDEASISSHIYLVPSNFPPSPSKYGNHFSLSGLGTPDITGSIGLYQYFVEDKPINTHKNKSGIVENISFTDDTAETMLQGPWDIFKKKPEPTVVKFIIHRDRTAKAALIEIQNHRILLKEGQWSPWIEVDFELSTAVIVPDKHIKGICRFYMQEVTPSFKLYVSSLNIDPADPSMRISEPANLSKDICKKLGLFPTLGFQEAWQARVHSALNDEEFAEQATMVLEERLRLLDYALKNYDDGLLFFYFSSTDMQAHIFWWDSPGQHPFRSLTSAIKYGNHIKDLYKKMDGVLGEIMNRYGNQATIITLSDHGFSSIKRRFSLNTWLRENGYVKPSYCTTFYPEKAETTTELYQGQIGVDWSKTKAYGLGLNALYLNLKGREQNGIVEPRERTELIGELITRLEAIRDIDGKPVVRKAYRSEEIYEGPEVKFAPDIVIGYYRGYRCDDKSGEGLIVKDVLWDSRSAWSADHCFDPHEVPGVLFCNRPIRTDSPNLTDLAPSILAEFGLNTPSSMEGKNIFNA